MNNFDIVNNLMELLHKELKQMNNCDIVLITWWNNYIEMK